MSARSTTRPAAIVSRAARAAAALLAILGALSGQLAAADDHRAGVPLLPSYRQECGACHLAYPPGMLPANSWKRLLGNLDRHYGTDASLEPRVAGELSAWLAANAATRKRVRNEPPQDRITRSAWFLREHDELPTAVWKRPSVAGPANCGACHSQADQGDFDEHRVRIPR